MLTRDLEAQVDRLIKLYKLDVVAALLPKVLLVDDTQPMARYHGDISSLVAELVRDARKVHDDPQLSWLSDTLGLTPYFGTDAIMRMHLDLTNAPAPRGIAMDPLGGWYNRLLSRAEAVLGFAAVLSGTVSKQNGVVLESDEMMFEMRIEDYTGRGVELARLHKIAKILDEAFSALAEITDEPAVTRIGYVESGSHWLLTVIGGAVSVSAVANGLTALYDKYRKRHVDDLNATTGAINSAVQAFGGIEAVSLSGAVSEETAQLMRTTLDRRLKRAFDEGLVPYYRNAPERDTITRLFPPFERKERRRIRSSASKPLQLGPGEECPPDKDG